MNLKQSKYSALMWHNWQLPILYINSFTIIIHIYRLTKITIKMYINRVYLCPHNNYYYYSFFNRTKQSE